MRENMLYLLAKGWQVCLRCVPNDRQVDLEVGMDESIPDANHLAPRKSA